MEYDFNDIIVEQIRQTEPDLDARLKAQSEALGEVKCTNPLIGKWFDEYDVEYLFAAFALNDKDFAENFPGMAHVTEHHRKRIAKEFEKHLDHCPHCSLHRGYQLEMDHRIERALRDNKELVIDQLMDLSTTSNETDPLHSEMPIPADS